MDFDEFDELEDFEEQEGNDISDLLSAYERHIEEEKYAFLDIDEFEALIDYYVMTKEPEKLAFALQNAEEIYPENPFIYLKRAFIALLNEDYSGALDWVEHASRIAGNSGEDMSLFLAKRADIYMDLEYFYQALLDLHYAIQLPEADKGYIRDLLEDVYLIIFNHVVEEDENIPGLEGMAKFLKQEQLLFLIKNFPVEAVKIFEHFTREDPFNAGMWNYLGLSLMETDDHQTAIEAFDYALAIDPASETAQFYKSICYKKNGLYEQAIETLLAIRHSPEDAGMIFFELGESLKHLKIYDEAVKYYRLAIEKAFREGDAYYALSKISLYENADYNLGLAYINKALSYQTTAPYLAWKARLLFHTGNEEEAEECFKKSVEMEPGDTQIWVQYAESYAMQNQYDRAIAIIDQALDKNFFTLPLLVRRISFLFKSGRKEEALSTLTLLLTYDETADSELISYAPELGDNDEFILLLDNIKQTIKSENKKSK